MNAEAARLARARETATPWRLWGPYLSERQWGTVREDYSASGDAWNYLSHDQARSRAYRWGEDGLAGLCDEQQRLCFALALWNGRDPILKERLFGLSNGEGNHGEDVKEYYFYLDSTPTHSYLKYLYKYPQREFPYTELAQAGRSRGRHEFECELLDTGVFEGSHYFDVFVEYAKLGPEDVLVQIEVWNRGPESAELHLLPTLWFRNTWSWQTDGEPQLARPLLRELPPQAAARGVRASHASLGEYELYCAGEPALLFTENETNAERIHGRPNATPYVKDAFHEYLVAGNSAAVNPARSGTKAGAHWRRSIGAGQCERFQLRLCKLGAAPLAEPFGPEFARGLTARRSEADAFYDSVAPASLGADERAVLRQALAGMLWSKQYYGYDVHRWLAERGSAPRNGQWDHLENADVISMPDKWEYPWYAAWDLAFHSIALGVVDREFAKEQLSLMLRDRYLHPNGQIPAYEWNFGDVNPPVHAWATAFLYKLDASRRGGEGDRVWLAHQFNKLLLNFGWWINRKDRNGLNAFEGGFLGLDNIGVFDRSAPLPTGGYLEQADGTAWMAVFCQHMVEIAAELARADSLYEDMVLKFAQHFLSIASALVRIGDEGMWDERDGFFYDVLRLPDGSAQRLRVRSLVGLLPICGVAVFDPEQLARLPHVGERLRAYLHVRPELICEIHEPTRPGWGDRRMLAIADERRLRRILTVMLDEAEFLSPYGLRSLSRRHAEQPYVFRAGGQEYRVAYTPAESDSGMFGGNSNWRGPVWFPVNTLLIRALLTYYLYYGDAFRIECPTGSGNALTLFEVAHELSRRLSALFLRGADGRRPVFGGTRVFQEDPHWRDHLLFYEYFHGDNGAGLGASHQTGWTGLVAPLLHFFGSTSAEAFLQGGSAGLYRGSREQRPAAAAAAAAAQKLNARTPRSTSAKAR